MGDEFLTTRWSLVEAVGSGDEERARAALAELCEQYWFPLYACARRELVETTTSLMLSDPHYRAYLDAFASASGDRSIEIRRDELAALWGQITEGVADLDGVAGFDLLNEPGNGDDVRLTRAGLSEFYRSAIEEIRGCVNP